MTNKKRELIEILLDNVKPEDWPESLPYAAQDKDCTVHYYSITPTVYPNDDEFRVAPTGKYKNSYKKLEPARNWNKTIVHRDEFMKRWNERNAVVDSEGWIQWNGGEMPVEKGTLIDVKYRCGIVNLHVKAGEIPSGGSIPRICAIDFKHNNVPGDIIAYRLHVPQEQKTPQQLALEKFGTDWHENDGVQPVNDKVLIDLIMCNGDEKKKYLANHWSWHKEQALKIKKWRVHSDEKESQAELSANPLACDDGTMPSEQVSESPLSTQIGGDHYKKLAIQPMQYSMKNKLDPLQHTVIKYVTRFRDKAGIEDLEKAKHCIDMLIEYEKENK